MLQHRIEGLQKVLGKKIYAQDFRAWDVDTWPDENHHVMCLRIMEVERPFLKLDLAALEGKVVYDKVITAADLKRDNINISNSNPENPALSRFGRQLLVPEREFTDFFGQPAALIYFKSIQDLKTFKKWLRRNYYNLFIYGEKDPDIQVRTDMKGLLDRFAKLEYFDDTIAYKNYHLIRIAGKDKDEFSSKLYPRHDPTMTTPEIEPDEKKRKINIRALDAFHKIETAMQDPSINSLDMTFSTQITDPAFLENESGMAWYDVQNDKIEILIGTQSPHKDIQAIEKYLFGYKDCRYKDVKVTLLPCYLGGAFGGRDASTLPVFLALASVYADGPVRMEFDRREQFLTGIKRHASMIRDRIAFDDSGRIKGLITTGVLDGGGQSNLTAPVLGLALIHGTGSYEIPMTSISMSGIQTFSSPAGSMRGFGVPQVIFGLESIVDEAACQLNMDPIDLRMNQLIQKGDLDPSGVPQVHYLSNIDICNQAKEHDLWKNRNRQKEKLDTDTIKYGVGFAICMQAFGTSGDSVMASVGFDKAGHLCIYTSGAEFGQGIATSLAIVPTDILGKNADHVIHSQSKLFDALELKTGKGFHPEDPRWTKKTVNSMSASMTAFHHIHIVTQACNIVFDHGIKPAARLIWGVEVNDVKWINNCLCANGLDPIPLEKLLATIQEKNFVSNAMVHDYFRVVYTTADFTVGDTTCKRRVDALAVTYGKSDEYKRINRQNVKFPDREMGDYRRSLYASIGHIVAVQVNTKSGKVLVQDSATFLDAGKVHHQQILEGQVEGGFAMGAGMALFEDLPQAPEGVNGKWNFHNYRLPKARHLPLKKMDLILIDSHPEQLVRKKGIGEATMSTLPPAIANAVRHATGVRVNSLPIKRDMLREVLNNG